MKALSLGDRLNVLSLEITSEAVSRVLAFVRDLETNSYDPDLKFPPNEPLNHTWHRAFAAFEFSRNWNLTVVRPVSVPISFSSEINKLLEHSLELRRLFATFISLPPLNKSNLLHTVKHGCTGWAPPNHLPLDKIFQTFKVNDSLTDIFMSSMALSPLLDNLELWKCLRGQIASNSKVLDVGGGSLGLQLAAVLAGDRDTSFFVYDLPNVCSWSLEFSKKLSKEFGTNLRFELVPGDFFASSPFGLQGVPTGAQFDAAMLAWILHDWESDDHCLDILKKTSAHLKPGGCIFLIERILPEVRSGPVAFYDFHMLAIANGRERTFLEYQILLKKAGFTDVEIMRSDGIRNVIKGTKG